MLLTGKNELTFVTFLGEITSFTSKGKKIKVTLTESPYSAIHKVLYN